MTLGIVNSRVEGENITISCDAFGYKADELKVSVEGEDVVIQGFSHFLFFIRFIVYNS